MNKFYILLLFVFLKSSLYAERVGLLITATGRYVQWVKPYIDSARKHFCKGHEVTYYVFTDGEIEKSADVVKVFQKKLGWPFDTLLRYQFYLENEELLKMEDYLFASDVDMLFVDDVGEEIFGEIVATLHPGFTDKRGSYETRRSSKAYVKKNEGEHYFAGGFYGGRAENVLKMCKIVLDKIQSDLKRDIIAVWHDESHWNRYCIDHPPTKILSPSYCYPESVTIPYKKKLVALDKNHHEVRQ